MKNILITGGLGYIGSHTSILLIENGYNLYIIDSLYNSELKTLNSIKEIVGKEFINKNIVFFNGDIRDFKFLDYVFRTAKNNGHKIDVVIHFAGLKSVKESFYKPFLYWDVNVEGTRNLIRAMDKFKCFNLIFSSSATVYGKVSNPPIKENCKVNPNNFYGFTKSKAENLIEKFYLKNKQKCRAIILRYFNPIGNNESGIIGESPNSDTNNLFPLLCNAAIHNKKDFKVFGNDWDTRDGTPIRDYVHVLDVAEGHISALHYLHGCSPS